MIISVPVINIARMKSYKTTLVANYGSNFLRTCIGRKMHTEKEANVNFANNILDCIGCRNKDGVKVYRNLSPARLYEEAIRHEKDTFITSTGALSATSNVKTGRSPLDKRLVHRESTISDKFWWGPVNIKLQPESFNINRRRAFDYMNTLEKLYVFDGYAGWHEKYMQKVRVICTRPYHALFMHNMLIRPTQEQLNNYGEPDFVIYNSGVFPANPCTPGMTSDTSVCIDTKCGELVILGTEYAGEMKKGVFTYMYYKMPTLGSLPLHASANEGSDGLAVFFGLSGTGKTTLSADPDRKLIGDDEHVWCDDGVFNIEAGCYAKCLNLKKEIEPMIFNAIKFGSILENVVIDENTREVQYDDKSKTENTRCAYPIDYAESAKIPCIGGHPTNIILLTCDAFGVLPPISKLTPEQAMYHFISGYTSKVPGTEMGVQEPIVAFSACFGAPFLVFHPAKYADMLAEKIKKHKANVWLVNTGWTGGKYKIGSRIPVKHSRSILNAIYSGELEKASYKTYSKLNLAIPDKVSNVPSEILNPETAWKGDKASYDNTINSLIDMFKKNFSQYESSASPEIIAAGPQ